MNPEPTKQCADCRQDKSIKDFGKNKAQPDQLHYYCKTCMKQKSIKNKEKNKAYYKEWAESNKDHLNEYHRKYRKANRNKLNEYQRERPDEKKKLANCSEKKKLREKTRRQQEAYKQQRNAYFKKKYHQDIQFQLKKQLEARFRILFLKNDVTIKSVELIGCTIPEFKLYVGSQFYLYPDMNWDNYGEEWEFDRIVPFCEFDLTNEEELHRCMHYSNVQPLYKTSRVINGVEYLGNLNKNRYLGVDNEKFFDGSK